MVPVFEFRKSITGSETEDNMTARLIFCYHDYQKRAEHVMNYIKQIVMHHYCCKGSTSN